MKRRVVALLAIVGLTAGLAGPVAPIAAAYVPSNVNLVLVKVAGGLSKPVLVTHAGDGSGRYFIVEQTGKVKVRKAGITLATPLIDLTNQVSDDYEQGLLGLAFHPQFETNRRLYVSYTDNAGDSIISEYKVKESNHDEVDMTTGRQILKVDQPYKNHNGGNIAFGRDGYLYIGFGDGGDGGDPGNRAQNLDTLLGKMLRIDIDRTVGTRQYGYPPTNPFVSKTGRDEIWSYGLRNPWRWSFDRVSGTLWIGDVGQGKWEEVDRATSNSGGGRGINYGWRVMEGRHCFLPATGCSLAGDTLPMMEYFHESDRCAVTGGFVYRGSTYPDLYGTYLFADYCSGEIWAVEANGPSPATAVRELDTSLKISSFGEDEAGNVYVTDLGGNVYRITDT